MRADSESDSWKVGPIGSDPVTVFDTTSIERVHLGHPCITTLPNGKIIVAVDQLGAGVRKLQGAKGQIQHSKHWLQGKLFMSSDKGQTWTLKNDFPFCNPYIFKDGQLHYLSATKVMSRS